MLNHFVSDLSAHPHTHQPHAHAIERRRALRIDLPFPAHVRFFDATGERYTLDVTIRSLSACGLYVHLPRPVAVGQRCFVVVQLVPGGDAGSSGPQVAVRGKVVRVDRLTTGTYGVALDFNCHRFLYVRPPAL